MIKEILKGIWAFCSYLFVPQKINHEDYSSDVFFLIKACKFQNNNVSLQQNCNKD